MTDLERFTNTVARRLAGQPEPERDQIAVNTGSDTYSAALAAESAYDDQDEDEESQDGPSVSLEDYANASALAMGFGPTTQEVAEARPLDDEDDDEDEGDGQAPAEGLPPDVARWWAGLDPATQEQIRDGTAEQLQTAYEAWAAETASRGEYEAAPIGPLPQTGAEFVAWAHANADGIRAEFDMSPDEYVAAMARANAQEWRTIANASGIPFEAKPSYRELGAGGQMALIKADLEADMERTRQRGGHW